MNPLPRLLAIYQRNELDLSTGLNPVHFGNDVNAQFSYLLKEGKKISTGAGITIQEIFFFQTLFEDFRPRNLFVIGNAFGWSTLTLALLNPGARVVAIDAAVEGSSGRTGIQFTNDVAQREHLNVCAVEATSPQDVAGVVDTQFKGGRVEFAFIDGLHTNEQQEADFDAVSAVASPDCVYAFHDVVHWRMTESFDRIIKKTGLIGRILLRTSSGMGILYPASVAGQIETRIRAFTQDSHLKFLGKPLRY